MGITFLSEMTSRFFAKILHNSMPVYHVVSIIEFISFTAIYILILKAHSKAIIYLSFVILILAVINSLAIQGLRNFPSNSVLVFQITYLGYSLLGLLKMLSFPIETPPWRQSFFWLNIALLVFSGSELLFFGLLNFSNRHHFNLNPLFTFNYIINLIYYCFLAVAIYLDSHSGKIYYIDEPNSQK